MEKTRKVKRFLALALAVVMVVGLMPHGANAQTIADGSKTCTVKAVDRNHFLTTDKGTRLGASYAEYTTNDGLTGPAYCIDHGLKYSSGNLEIRGVYDANPETAAAFAQSYPQHSLETFLGRYPKPCPVPAYITCNPYTASYGVGLASSGCGCGCNGYGLAA